VHEFPQAYPLGQQSPPCDAAQLNQPPGHEVEGRAAPVDVINAVTTYEDPPVDVPTGTTTTTPFDVNVEEEAAAGQLVVEQSRPT
jgi:hypothetical protein